MRHLINNTQEHSVRWMVVYVNTEDKILRLLASSHKRSRTEREHRGN